MRQPMADYAMFDDDDDGPYECAQCGDGEQLKSACIDDICHGGDVPCMHGSYAAIPCQFCNDRWRKL